MISYVLFSCWYAGHDVVIAQMLRGERWGRGQDIQHHQVKTCSRQSRQHRPTSVSSLSFMCLVYGDSIVGAAPSPKLSPRPGQPSKPSSQGRENLGSHARSLQSYQVFLRDRQSSTTTLLKSSVLTHRFSLPST